MASRDRIRRRLAKCIKDQDGLCYFCRRLMGGGKTRATIDHLTARANGGSYYNPRNLRAACFRCNNLKGPLDAVTFKRLMNNPKELQKAKDAETQRLDAAYNHDLERQMRDLRQRRASQRMKANLNQAWEWE